MYLCLPVCVCLYSSHNIETTNSWSDSFSLYCHAKFCCGTVVPHIYMNATWHKQLKQPWRPTISLLAHVQPGDSGSPSRKAHAVTQQTLLRDCRWNRTKSWCGFKIPCLKNYGPLCNRLGFTCQDTVKWPPGWGRVTLWCLEPECWSQILGAPLVTRRQEF